jgi:hypothetical protein
MILRACLVVIHEWNQLFPLLRGEIEQHQFRGPVANMKRPSGDH